ncbi:MAG: ATP synthase F1 subunit delta [Bdellovibrionales bacterium]
MSSSHKPKAVAGKGPILARRYAVALLELAEEKKLTDSVMTDLEALGEAIEGNRSFRILAAHPRCHRKMVVDVMTKLASVAKFNDLTTAFLLRVAAGKRLGLLGLMIDAFRDEVAVLRRQYTAIVSVPCALKEEQKTALSAQLGKITGGTVDLIVEEDKSLLGGLTVQMGSRLIDASVKGKLGQIEQQLKLQREAA